MAIDPIGAITTLRALTGSLIDSIQDRKAAADLREIQAIISSLDAEYFRMRKESLKLETDYAQLQQRILPIEARMTAAEDERDKLKIELSDAKAKLSILTAQEERKRSKRLPEESEKMLVVLANKKPRQEITQNMLIAHFQYPQARGEYYFDALERSGFIEVTHGMANVGAYWAVTPGGRKYLVENALI